MKHLVHQTTIQYVQFDAVYPAFFAVNQENNGIVGFMFVAIQRRWL